MGLIRKRKRANDDENGPVAKRMRRGFFSAHDEDLSRSLRYPDEGPSRRGSWGEEVEVIDLTTSDPE